MLTEEKKVEIRKLKEQGLNISQIARRTSVDWKTVKQCVTAKSKNYDEKGADEESRHNDSKKTDAERVKIIFKRLNSGESPSKIVGEIGDVDLVLDLHKKWKQMEGLFPKELSAPDLRILGDTEAWIESVEKFPEWHQMKAIKALAGFAIVRSWYCANYRNRDVECALISENDFYECISCTFFSKRA